MLRIMTALGVLAIVACDSATNVEICSETVPCINIGLQNSSPDVMTIQITNGGATRSIDADVGYTSLEFPGSTDDAITFRARQGASEATGICTATPEMRFNDTPSDVYGQVNFVSGGGAILIECATGWEESL